MTIRVTGTGSALPEKIVTNFELQNWWKLLMNGFVNGQVLQNAEFPQEKQCPLCQQRHV